MRPVEDIWQNDVSADLAAPEPDEPRSESVPTGEPSFDRIFHDEVAYVGRTLRYLGVSDAHLEDACQEVFVVVHKHLGQVGPGSARAWVRQIALRVASNHRRTLRRRREDAVAEPPEVAAPAQQQEEVERLELRRRLLDALDTLTDEQRTVFVLYEIEQFSMPEIAETIGCPQQTAYSRLYAARTRVRMAMKGMEP